MLQPSVVPVTQADPTLRSTIYRMLSLVFRYPAQEIFELYKSGEFLSELFDGMTSIPHLEGIVDEEAGLVDEVRKDLKGMTFRDFEVAYTQTFDVGAPEPPCPPYEGLHRKGVERTGLMIEVSEFYKHFGLNMNQEEGKRDLPDNLSAELEFLHFLTFKEAQAREEGAGDLLKGYVLAQKDFLERHMINWLPDFSDKLGKSSRLPFFADLGRIASRIVLSEFVFVGALLKDSAT